jgi:hypothetical protein
MFIKFAKLRIFSNQNSIEAEMMKIISSEGDYCFAA